MPDGGVVKRLLAFSNSLLTNVDFPDLEGEATMQVKGVLKRKSVIFVRPPQFASQWLQATIPKECLGLSHTYTSDYKAACELRRVLAVELRQQTWTGLSRTHLNDWPHPYHFSFESAFNRSVSFK